MAKLRANCKKIHEKLGARGVEVPFVFGRLATQAHNEAPRVCFVPVGGTIAEAFQRGGKKVAGPAGPIVPGPAASLTQPDTDERVFSCATREPKVAILIVAGDGEDEEQAVDDTEKLLEDVIAAAFQAFAADVTFESENWLTQDEQRASWGVAGQAVLLTIGFRLPVVYENRKLVQIVGQQETCKLDNTFTSEA